MNFQIHQNLEKVLIVMIVFSFSFSSIPFHYAMAQSKDMNTIVLENIQQNLQQTSVYVLNARQGEIVSLGLGEITEITIDSVGTQKLAYSFKVKREYQIEYTELLEASAIVDPEQAIFRLTDRINFDNQIYIQSLLYYGDETHFAQYEAYYLPYPRENDISHYVCRNFITSIDAQIGDQNLKRNGDIDIEGSGASYLVHYTLTDLNDQVTVFKQASKIKAIMNFHFIFGGNGIIQGDLSSFDLTQDQLSQALVGDNEFNAFLSQFTIHEYIWIMLGVITWTIIFWSVIYLRNNNNNKKSKKKRK